MSSHFHQEFPSLQAAGEVEKGDGQDEEPYGPGPSLRPQSNATLMHNHQVLLDQTVQGKKRK